MMKKLNKISFTETIAGPATFIIIMLALGCGNNTGSDNPADDPAPAQQTPEATPPPTPTDLVLMEIRQKLAAINDYSVIYQDTFFTPQGEIARRDLRYFKRPNLFATTQTQVAHVSLELVDSTYKKICDGQTFWDYFEHAPGSAQYLAQRLRSIPGMTNEQLQKDIQRHAQPQLFSYNLQQFKDAGFSAEWEMGRAGLLLKPFAGLECNMDTLELVSDEGDFWILISKPKSEKPIEELGEIRMTFAKQTGTIQNATVTRPDDSDLANLTFADIKINQDLEDDLFIFRPPPDLEVVDRTAAIIKFLTGN